MGVSVQLLAQTLDVGIDCAVIADMLIAPHEREQVVAREHAPRRGGEGVEQLRLLAREAELMPVQRDAQRGQMDRQAADDQRFAGRMLVHAADNGADARHDLARGERLDDVVVRADIQAENAVRILVLGGDHQDWNIGHRTDAAAYVQAVDAREHDIQQHQRGGGRVKQGQRLLAGAGSQIGPAFGLHIFGKNFQDLLVVVNDQDGIQANSSISVLQDKRLIYDVFYCKICRDDCQFIRLRFFAPGLYSDGKEAI